MDHRARAGGNRRPAAAPGRGITANDRPDRARRIGGNIAAAALAAAVGLVAIVCAETVASPVIAGAILSGGIAIGAASLAIFWR